MGDMRLLKASIIPATKVGGMVPGYPEDTQWAFIQINKDYERSPV